MCAQLLRELVGVLERPKFRRWISLPDAARYCRDLAELATMVRDPVEIAPLSRDPGDDYLLAVALAERADALVSGDSDLLEVADSPVTILAPTHVLELLDSVRRPS